MGVVLLHRLGQCGLDDVLHDRIDGEHHVEAVARFHVLLAQRNQLAPAAVRFRHPPAAHARSAWS